jgi:hypothetical protein
MGYLQASEMAAHAPLETAVQWHLQHNHYPPVDLMFVPTVIEAIGLAQDEDWDAEIELPNGVVLSVGEIVDQLHLGAFVDYDDERETD